MGEPIDVGQGRICVIRKSKRARRLCLTLHRDGKLFLTLPRFVSYARGRAFLASKSEWIEEKMTALALRPDTLLLRGGKKEYEAARDSARKLLEERLAYFQPRYGVAWKKVTIRNQKTRFGSCSRGGALSFNYRLLFLPPHLCDYVVVHELCHLIEFNHSPKFWALVARTFPDFRTLRRELRLL